MSLFTKNFYKKGILALLVPFFLSGCGTEYEQLKAHFFGQRYLETIETAVKARPDVRYQDQIDSFCKEYGNQVYEKAFTGIAKECLNPTSPAGLHHLNRLQTAIEEGIRVQLPVSNAYTILNNCTALKKIALRDFLATQRTLGSEALIKHENKKAVAHFKLYLEFQANDADIEELLKDATKISEKHIVITRFYTQAETLTDTVKNELSFISDSRRPGLTIKTVTRIEGLNVNELLFDELFNTLLKKKDAFLILYKEGDPAIPSRAIRIEGHLTTRVFDTENTPIRSLETGRLNCLKDDNGIQRWQYETFEYPIYTMTYQVTLKASVDTLSTSPMDIEGSHLDTRMYRTDEIYWTRPFNVIQVEYPPAYQALNNRVLPIDREYACRAAVDDLAKNLADKIMEEFR